MMVELRLLASVATYLIVATTYAYVGTRLLQRRGHGDAQRARGRFAVFWFGLGTHSLLAATLTYAEMVGEASMLLTALCAYAAAVAIAAMSWGMMSYLIFLYAGRAIVFRLVTVAYVVQLVPLVAAVWVLGPIGVHMEGWIPMLDYADPNGSALDPIVTLAFLIPPFLAAGSYVALWRRLTDAPSRWRMGLIGGSITLWFGSAVLGAAIQTPGSDTGAIIARAVAILAGLVVLAAYEPPAWAQRRFRAVRIGHEVVAPSLAPHVMAERRAALAARARELV